MIEILADSRNPHTGDRLTTFLLRRFPRCLLAELNTHRMLSRNAESSRAIPVLRRIEKVKGDPYIPSFTANQRGMVGAEIDDRDRLRAENTWLRALRFNIAAAQSLAEQGIHKDMANRLLEPFVHVPVIVSGTEWDNFFTLRTSPQTNPDFRAIAIAMQELMADSTPKLLPLGDWHISFGDRFPDETDLITRLRCSAARCARLSYCTHDGEFSIEADLALFDRLTTQGHLSPLEHQAYAAPVGSANFRGFESHRKLWEASLD